MSEFPDQALLKQRHQLREMAQGFRPARILLTCVELGIFKVLKDGPANAGQAAAIDADLRGTELLLNAAAALGLLDKSADRFS
ncbi:MAG TPA: hypothetical protein ENN99_00340 [Chloroflexi bacterium]|nr:hypothetical protein [Chloroflexota bacterium]